MQLKKHILYFYAETAIHTGIGTGLGAVDMPIQREKHTAYPMIQASGVKGALRDTTELALKKKNPDDPNIGLIFGGASGDTGEDFAGAMSPSDARILLFPVRALRGVFVWVTCPTVLARFQRETGVTGLPEVEIAPNQPQVSSDALLMNGKIMLEEYTYEAKHSEAAQKWAAYLAANALQGADKDFWKARLQGHFVILPDDDFRDFVRYSTEIVTRIHIDDDKKTVKDGQLFTQELLPADSVLYSVLHVTDSRNKEGKLSADDVVQTLKDNIGQRLQIGANETVGRGRVQLTWQQVEA